jgi:hypothetical protein
MFPSRDLAIEGKADQLNPYYYYLNQFFRATIDPKLGDATALRYYASNLFNRMHRMRKDFAYLTSFGMS